MNMLREHRFAAVTALFGIAIGSGLPISAYGAAATSTQPKAVISNPTTTTAISPPGLLPQAAPPAAVNGPPAPRIIVIDRNFILQRADNTKVEAGVGESRISTSGSASVTGSLEDGRKFKASSMLAKNGD